MATWGLAWPAPQALTLSFAPDGTAVAGQRSQLFQSLDAQLGAGNWEGSILKAVQTWASNANINVGVVTDGGEPIGTPGPAQGDPRFGDIRITAAALAPGVVATTAPYDPSLGTYAGDVILNSSYDFDAAESGGYDLYTVMLHEAGHVFGFADSSDPSSFMSNVYTSAKTGIGPDAVSALQALYGPPVGSSGYKGSGKASPIPNPPSGSTVSTVTANLSAPQQQDFYAIQAPSSASTAGADFSVKTAGISLLVPSLTVFDAAGNSLATSSASGPLDGGASVHLNSVTPGGKYLVEVAGATGDVFAVGAYQLSVNLNAVGKGGGGPGKATSLPEPKNYTGETPLIVTGQIASAATPTLYSFTSPAANPNGVTVQLTEWGIGLKAPQVQILDASGRIVASASTSDPSNTNSSVHLDGVIPNSTYYVLATTGINTGLGVGTFQLQVSFNSAAQGSSAVTMTMPNIPVGVSGKNPTNNTTIGQAAQLQSPDGSRYATLGTLSTAAPQNFYSLGPPKLATGQSKFMTVTVEALQAGGLDAWATVFDNNGNPVPALCLAHEGGIVVLQVPVDPSVKNYILEVAPSQPGGPGTSGDYYLGVQFGAAGAVTQSLASGALTAPNPVAPPPLVGFTADQPRYYRFLLGATAGTSSPGLAVQATIQDANGNVVATMTTPANEAASLTVFLAPGSYTIAIMPVNQVAGASPPISWTLTDEALSDPILPYTYKGSGASGSTLPS